MPKYLQTFEGCSLKDGICTPFLCHTEKRTTRRYKRFYFLSLIDTRRRKKSYQNKRKRKKTAFLASFVSVVVVCFCVVVFWFCVKRVQHLPLLRFCVWYGLRLKPFASCRVLLVVVSCCVDDNFCVSFFFALILQHQNGKGTESPLIFGLHFHGVPILSTFHREVFTELYAQEENE